ncbi:MAG: hypothetical protein Q8S13_14725, partial [Dehalococcoidia bacterium]|nr:hypothetical protein [Dehalococcoidia bacterium]
VAGRDRRGGDASLRHVITHRVILSFMRMCVKCRRSLPVIAFYRDRHSSDGLNRQCRTCVKSYMMTRRPFHKIRRRRLDGLPAQPRVPPVISLTTRERAYIAGIIDGEGCVRIASFTHFAMVIFVVNTHLGLLEWLRGKLGGSLNELRNRPDGQKQVWRWNASTLRAISILRLVIDDMIVKRRQAEIMLAFYDAIPVYKETHPGGISLPLGEPLASLYAELRALNHRGPRP